MRDWIKACQKKISSIPHLKSLVLILLKEIYLFLKNLYGLLTHPFKTIVRIRKKPDRSQTILVLGLPVWGWLGTSGVLAAVGVGVWFLKPASNVLLKLVLAGVVLIFLLTVAATGYVGYWVGRYWLWKKKKYYPRSLKL